MPNLWALWDDDINPTLIFVSDQHIAFELNSHQTTGLWRLSMLPHLI